KIVHPDIEPQEHVAVAKVLVAQNEQKQNTQKHRVAHQRAAVAIQDEHVACQPAKAKLQRQKQKKRLRAALALGAARLAQVEYNNERGRHRKICQQQEIIKNTVRALGYLEVKQKAEDNGPHAKVVLVPLPKFKRAGGADVHTHIVLL